MAEWPTFGPKRPGAGLAERRRLPSGATRRRPRPLGNALAMWRSGGSASSLVGGGAQECSEAVRYVSSHCTAH